MAVLVPIPTTASLTITDLVGATKGGGPWSITRAKSIALPIEGVKIDSGPFLTTDWKENVVGSLSNPFQLVLEPDMGITTGQFQWNSVDHSQLMWFHRVFNNRSNVKFIYGATSATPSTTNLVYTIHLRQLDMAPPAPGDPDTLAEYTISMLSAYIKIDDGVAALTYGTALA